MSHHAFTVEVAGVDYSQRRFEDAFFEAGCDDAMIAVINGRLMLDFDREAPTYDQAVESAKRDVAQAGGHVVAVAKIND